MALPVWSSSTAWCRRCCSKGQPTPSAALFDGVIGDTARLRAAYRLGLLSSGGHDDENDDVASQALAVLFEALDTDEQREEVHRAASYGLSAAGAAAATGLIDRLLQLQTTSSGACSAFAGGLPLGRPDLRAAAVPRLVHALGNLSMDLSGVRRAKAAAAVIAVAARAVAEIAIRSSCTITSTNDADARPGEASLLDFSVQERRRALAECAHASGHLGVAAIRAADEATAAAATAFLLRLLEPGHGIREAGVGDGGPNGHEVDLGSELNSALSNNQIVRHAAAMAIVRICSAGDGGRAAAGVGRRWPGRGCWARRRSMTRPLPVACCVRLRPGSTRRHSHLATRHKRRCGSCCTRCCDCCPVGMASSPNTCGCPAKFRCVFLCRRVAAVAARSLVYPAGAH